MRSLICCLLECTVDIITQCVFLKVKGIVLYRVELTKSTHVILTDCPCPQCTFLFHPRISHIAFASWSSPPDPGPSGCQVRPSSSPGSQESGISGTAHGRSRTVVCGEGSFSNQAVRLGHWDQKASFEIYQNVLLSSFHFWSSVLVLPVRSTPCWWPSGPGLPSPGPMVEVATYRWCALHLCAAWVGQLLLLRLKAPSLAWISSVCPLLLLSSCNRCLSEWVLVREWVNEARCAAFVFRHPPYQAMQ